MFDAAKRGLYHALKLTTCRGECNPRPISSEQARSKGLLKLLYPATDRRLSDRQLFAGLTEVSMACSGLECHQVIKYTNSSS